MQLIAMDASGYNGWDTRSLANHVRITRIGRLRADGPTELTVIALSIWGVGILLYWGLYLLAESVKEAGA